MKRTRSMLSLLLTLCMVVSVVPAFAETSETPLVVAYAQFSEKFSPFFGETAYDMDVADMTQISLMTTDRMGGIVYNAIEGETIPYNGTDYEYKGAADLKVEYDEEADVTTYTAKLREDLKFSDGEPVTADDVIFTYYAYLDPSYTGPTSLSSYPIIGLNDYRTQTTSDVYDKYAKIADDMFAAGIDHEWAETDAWTKEQQEAFWGDLTANWKTDVKAIVDYVFANYLSYAPDYTGYTGEEIQASDGLKVALGMALWGFGKVEDKVLTTNSGKTFDLSKEEYPTLETYYEETYTAYDGNVVEYASVESPNSTDIFGVTKDAFIGEWGPKDEAMGGEGVPNVAGIKKLDEYTVEVKTNGYEAPAVYSILGISVAPLHYYGDEAQYDYENNMFGFPFGDLSIVAEKTGHPIGAGAYKFVKYENRIVYFEANENYYKGMPKTKYIQFKETNTAEVATGIQSGVVDAGEMSGSKANFETVAKMNSNGEITGDVVTTSKVDNLGYGYIGLNADTVNVGGEPASEASKNLRKAFGTVYAVYRAMAYDSYYGEAASVINYPISNTSWAAPQSTDPDYKVAFSVDVDGNDIYTSEMNAEERYDAALQAATGFLKAAGYTFDEATGMFTAAPEGAKLAYEVIIPGDGTGDHPSFAVLTGAKGLLEKIGITLNINDPADANILWEALDSGLQEMWTAAWGATIDPDMYQVYHSSNVVGKGGTDSNHYHIADEELDQLIIEARRSDDQAFRKAVYKQALDLVVDWAVEVPAYQRQNSIVFSTQRINMNTVTPDITTFWGWMNDIELIEMN
ncbi:MAG: ABC transporter substrate-binding protein [Eubacteriales bacterium]|nr:ABC transporter substrate-binding protein [Eubacteriales bacterium]